MFKMKRTATTPSGVVAPAMTTTMRISASLNQQPLYHFDESKAKPTLKDVLRLVYTFHQPMVTQSFLMENTRVFRFCYPITLIRSHLGDP